MLIKIFESHSIDSLDWTSVMNGQILKGFYEPILQNSSKIYVKNSDHVVSLLQVGDKVYPLSLGKRSVGGTCYLFSFLSQYVDYTREEILTGEKYSNSQKLIVNFFFPALKILGSWLGMEKVVFINNFFLATNLYEGSTEVGREMVIKYLKRYYPERAIAFRSVNDATDVKLLNDLTRQGGLPLACRQLYVLDPKNGIYKKKRPFIQDRKLWEKTNDLHWERANDLSKMETFKALEFYKELYLKKYSALNPDYTGEFLHKSLHAKTLHYYLLRENENNMPVAIQAIAKSGEVICTPFIGYDQSQPKERGLYRIMNQQLTSLAVEEEKILNMSSGAASFKKQRGGIPCFDYHVVFVDHLSWRQQWIWKRIYAYSESSIKPTMKALGV